MIPVFTFVSDDSSYDEMLASFESAGFSSDIAMFNRLTSRGRPGEPEPYSTITELIESVQEPYFILCHQDVRIDPGNGVDDLTAQLALLSANGSALGGGRQRGRVAPVENGSAHHRPSWRQHPGSAASTCPDSRREFPRPSNRYGIGLLPGLHGFHLYGTDACMNARVLGFSAYVIDFHVHHLSAGKMDVDYETCRARVSRCMEPSLPCAATSERRWRCCSSSRWAPLRALLGSTRARRVIKNRPWLGRLVGAVFARQ